MSVNEANRILRDCLEQENSNTGIWEKQRVEWDTAVASDLFSNSGSSGERPHITREHR